MSQPPDTTAPQFQLDLNHARRREFVARCNEAMQDARGRALRNCCRLGGLEGCQKLSDEVDAILRSMWEWLVKEAGLPPAEYSRISLVALGGYGRSQLNPYSDVDLLFLMPDDARPVEHAFVKSLLYLLWDIGKLDIGYATKRICEALASVGTELDSTTALMETRLVAGNQAALNSLLRQFAKLLRGPNRRWFLESKIEEYKERRNKYGSTVYLLEPNVKEGEGGLRDIHSLQWLSYALLGSTDLNTLPKKGVLEEAELKALLEAMDFMLCVRTALHTQERRKADVLSFDRQPGVASLLGYQSDKRFLAEEKMMQDYYLRARTIDRYGQKATRVLTSRARTLLGGMLELTRRKSLNAHYYVKGGVLFHKHSDPETFRRNPSAVMECFWIATLAGAVLSEELKVTFMAVQPDLDSEEFRSSSACREFFMRTLGEKHHVAQTLHAMHETGVLMSYIPEFRKIFCLVRIDHYHRYTVDEHLIKTLEMSEELVSGQNTQWREMLQAAREIKRWDLLNLSLLLHDIGKGEGHGHVLRGAILSQKITQRMGLPPEDQEVVRQLILQHLKMSHIAQRRDLEDPLVIDEMAKAIPDPELLRMLYVLTYCDIRAVGPNAWTDWKAALLFDLYRKTMLLLEGKDPIKSIEPQDHKQLVEEIQAGLGEKASQGEIERLINNAPPKYLNSVAPAKIASHLLMMRRLGPENRIVWEVDQPQQLNYTEITAVSYDVAGFMSMVCAALSSKDVNILSVQVYSTKDGYAIDIFQVTDLRGNRLPHGFRLERLRSDLNRVLLGKARATEVFATAARASQVRRDLAALKPSVVLLDNDASPNFTLLEVKTLDRPGLLYQMTSTCAEQGYYIHLAMITTEAYRVVDVFYITDMEFNKLEPSQVKRLQSALEQVLA